MSPVGWLQCALEKRYVFKIHFWHLYAAGIQKFSKNLEATSRFRKSGMNMFPCRGAIIQNAVARGTWCFGFVRPDYRARILQCNNSYRFRCCTPACSLNTVSGKSGSVCIIRKCSHSLGLLSLALSEENLRRHWKVPLNAMKVYWYEKRGVTPLIPNFANGWRC